MTDNINPNYYSGRKCLDIIADVTKELSGELAFDIGTAIKYLYRFKGKNGVEDLRKAKKYIEFAIEFVELHEITKEDAMMYNITMPDTKLVKKKLPPEAFGAVACEKCKHLDDPEGTYPCNECINGIDYADPKQKDAPLLWEANE